MTKKNHVDLKDTHGWATADDIARATGTKVPEGQDPDEIVFRNHWTLADVYASCGMPVPEGEDPEEIVSQDNADYDTSYDPAP